MTAAPDRAISDFVRALRSADVRVSPGETIDAARTLEIVGYGDRARLKDSLACVLAKSLEEKETHDRLFDLYFSRRKAEPEPESGKAAAPEERPAEATSIRELVERGDETEIALALEAAGQAAGVSDIRFTTQTGVYAQRMLKMMGVEALESDLLDRLRAGAPQDQIEAEDLMAARSEMMRRARDYVEQQFEVFGAGETERFREDILSERRISALDQNDLDRIQPLIAKIARKLAVKHSRRRKMRNRGQLDVRRTLRANAGLDGALFDLAWRRRRRDKPRIVVICDVSGSVAQSVRLLLLLLYGLNDVVSDLRPFAFSGRLDEVGDDLSVGAFAPAMDRIINRLGMSPTDYGQALSDLKTRFWSAIDRRTTVLILGDGRSNYGDPRLDIFKDLGARAKRVLWLCTEPRPLWGSGDSAMLRYEPYCHGVSIVSTLKDLERAVDAVLAGYR